eukprot:gene11150-11302_t
MGLSPQAAVATAFASFMKFNSMPVALLKQPLTDDLDHDARAAAVQLLSQVAEGVPEALRQGDVAVMAEFLGSKLQDWRCLGAAAPGCLALLQRHQQPSLPQLPQDAAVGLVKQFSTVNVQGLDYKGRLTCYKLLLEILQGPYAVGAVLAGVDLVCHTWASMERETDPRCLLAALQCVKAVGLLHQHPALSEVAHLDDNLEDLFDVGVAAYFPVMFTPPKNDPHSITRDMLLRCTIDALACCPQFASLGIPLLSEKMGSSLKQAKADALQALPACLSAWGPAACKPHMQAVWLMLKAELMAPAAADGLLSEQQAAKSATAEAAAVALCKSVVALGPGLLDRHVLNDVIVEDLQQYLGLSDPPWAVAPTASAGVPTAVISAASSASWDLPERAQRRLACIAKTVAAVAAAGGASCDAVCSEILAPAVAAVLADTAAGAAANEGGPAAHQPSRPLQADCAVLCVLHEVASAVASAASAVDVAHQFTTAPQSPTTINSQFAAITTLAPEAAQLLTRLQQQRTLVLPRAPGNVASVTSIEQQQQQQHHELHGDLHALQSLYQHPEDLLQLQHLHLWRLLLWQDIFRLRSHDLPCLQQQQMDTAAQQLVQQALHGSSETTQLQLAPSITTSMQEAATTALTLMAAGDIADHAPSTDAAQASGIMALQLHAAPLLLQLVAGQTSSNGSSTRLWSNALHLESAAQLSGGSQAARATLVLQRLAGSNSVMAWQVLCWIQPLVLTQIKAGNWAMAWLSKALAMQRHDGWQQGMQALVQLLGVLPLHSAAQAASPAADAAMVFQGCDDVLWGAADYFGVLVTLPVREAAAAGHAATTLGGTAASLLTAAPAAVVAGDEEVVLPLLIKTMLQANSSLRALSKVSWSRRPVQCVAKAEQTRPVSRRLLVGTGLLTGALAGTAHADEEQQRTGEQVVHNDQEWRALLTPGQYKILRQAGTELPNSSPLNKEKRRGTFVCAGCGAPLFRSDAKYNSGTGWPSFFEPLDGAVVESLDTSIFFMPRTEVSCRSCGGHLGHVFEDGPPPTGQRYCMNGLALQFEPADKAGLAA